MFKVRWRKIMYNENKVICIVDMGQTGDVAVSTIGFMLKKKDFV